jgi:pimeloyl-ACP methyl ester carboxylesterase
MSTDNGLIDRMRLAAPLFYPRADTSPAPPGATDLFLEAAPGVPIAARHYVADPAFPAVLYFHGNGEVVGDHDDIAPSYHRIGLNLFVVDYRGYGRSGGRPSFAALIDDAHPIAEQFHAALDRRGMLAPRFLMGRSLGGYPALELAARRPDRFRGLLLESAAANLRRLIARFVEPVAASLTEPLVAAHEAKIASITLPTLLLHGERDELIPLSHATGIHDLLAAADRSLVVIPGVGHNDILWRGHDQYFEAIRAFVTRQLA